MSDPTSNPNVNGGGATAPARQADELDLERLKLEFEKEKHRDDLALRRRELEGSLAQTQQSLWKSPLFLALVAAVVGLLSNAAVALINGYSQRSLEVERAKITAGLEKQKAEAERILEALKTGSADKAAENLEFMVNAELVTTGADALRKYLKERQPGSGASLPVPNAAGPPPSDFRDGKDDRLTVKALKEPLDAICEVRTMVSMSTYVSTGFFIHPRVMVVAAMPGPQGPDGMKMEVFLPTTDDGIRPGQVGIKAERFIPLGEDEFTNGFGLLLLPEAGLPAHSAFTLPDAPVPIEELRSAPLNMAAFYVDVRQMLFSVGRAESVSGNMLLHSFDTGPGSSGAPIWMVKDGKHVVVAVHQRATPSERGAIRIDGDKLRAKVKELLGDG